MPKTAYLQDGRLREQALPICALIFMVSCWLLGGVTEDPEPWDETLQLLAIPVLALAFVALFGQHSSDRLRHVALAALCAIVAVPLLQLLPVGVSFWRHASAVRLGLAQDMKQAGIDPGSIVPFWSLAPEATERGLWALMPGVAMFLAGLGFNSHWRPIALKLVLALACANLLFAFFQAGLPVDSPLVLYPETRSGLGGLFVHTNHQATAMLIAIACAVGLAARSRKSARTRGGPNWELVYLGLAALLFMVMPWTMSRAGVVLSLPVFALAVVLTGELPLQKLRSSKRIMAAAVGVGLLVATGIWAAIGWIQVDVAEEMRYNLARATFALGDRNAPLGSGIGSFVHMFEQHAPAALQGNWYVNHAHNEYAQWWLTGGVAAACAVALTLWALAIAAARLISAKWRTNPVAAASFVAVTAVLMHSWVEYPLQTPALLATTSMLAGVMVAGLMRRRERSATPARQGSESANADAAHGGTSPLLAVAR